MGNLNKVLLIGHLGQDPEKKVTPNGNSVVTISLATTEKFNDKDGNKQEKTEWHRVVFWNKQAELIDQYCKKGTQLYVEGTLQTREWQNKGGNKRWSTEIIARNMQFLGGREQSNQQQGQQSNQQQNSQQRPNNQQNNRNQGNQGQQNNNQQQPPDDFFDSEIPF